MADLITFKGSRIEVNGTVLTGRASQIVRSNVGYWVGELADQGVELVKAGIRTKNGSGETAAGVEAYHNPPNSLFATVRMKPGLTRSPGSPGWPAERRPYVINAVLASGIYRGERNQKRRKLDMWNRAAYRLRARAKQMPTSLLLRGL